MARVFDTPTYKMQTYHGLINVCDLAFHQRLQDKRLDISRFKKNVPVKDGSTSFFAGLIEMNIDFLDQECGQFDYEIFSDHEKFCYSEGLKSNEITRVTRLGMFGSVLMSVFKKHAKQKIITDFEAVFEICRLYYSGEMKATASTRAKNRWSAARKCADTVFVAGVGSCNVGNSVMKGFADSFKDPMSGCKEYCMATNAAEAWEKMRLSGSTKKVAESHNDLAVAYANVNNFLVEENYPAKNLGFEAIYKVSLFSVFVTSKYIFVLDFAHLDQLRALMRTWAGSECYAANYRLTTPGRTTHFWNAYRECFAWMVEAMLTVQNTEALAKYMKTGLSIIQNNFHDHSEKLDLKSAERSAELVEEMKSILHVYRRWDEILLGSGCNLREANNLAYIFHMLPSPDADPRAVYNRVVGQMNNANVASPEEFPRFLNYCKALDVSEFVYKSKGRVHVNSVEGYDYRASDWYKTCVRGIKALPPSEDWGKCWLENVIPVPTLMNTWYTTASDVTRIPPKLDNYDSMMKRMRVSRYEGNELLYVLKNAPYIDGSTSPADVLEMTRKRKHDWDRVADMSVKAENTKFGEKMRETWSADAITREVMTEYDHAMIPVATHYPGVTSRKSDEEVLKIFDKICKYTVERNYSIVASVDTSGWSPSADRKAWCEHHDYRLGLTSHSGTIKLYNVLDGIHAAICKRGFLRHDELKDGMFQGWTGTADSILNVATSTYCVRKGKESGYFTEQIKADTAGLIDDAVQGIVFPRHTTLADAQRAADEHYSTTTKVWGAISASINTQKTIYSSIKFIYLNRFHCEGSEVLTDMKTFSKVDRDYTRRLSSINTQCDTVFGGYRAASGKGSDPFLCYYMALYRCMDLLIQTNHTIAELDNMQLIAAAFAPRGLGGLGFTHIIGFLSKECNDPLSMYTGIIARISDLLASVADSTRLQAAAEGFINQPLKKPGPLGVLSDPMNVIAKSTVNVEGGLYRKLMKGMRGKCESKVIQDAFDIMDSPFPATAAHALLTSFTLEAGLVSAMGKVSPENVVKGLVDKAHRADLLLSLFPFRLRKEMISKLRAGGYDMVKNVVDIASKRRAPQSWIDTDNCAVVASDIRNKYLMLAGYRITSHTISDPGTSLARTGEPHDANLTVYMKPAESACNDLGTVGMYANIYDGHSQELIRGGFVTKGVLDGDSAAAKGLDPVQRCIMRLARICAHLSSTGNDAEAADIWRIGIAMWGVTENVRRIAPMIYFRADSSWKRMLDSSFTRTHPIACYPNTHNCVITSARRLAAVYDNLKTTTNFASVVTAGKLVGLLNACNLGNREEVLHFSVIAGSVALTSNRYIAVEVSDPDALNDFYAWCDAGHGHATAEAFMSAMNNYIDVMPEDDNVAAVVFPGLGGQDIDNDAIRRQINMFYRDDAFQLLDVEMHMRRPARQRVHRVSRNYDMADQERGVSLEARYRQYIANSNGDTASAGIRVFLDQLATNLPARMPDSFYAMSPRDLINVMNEVLPEWDNYVKTAISALTNLRHYEQIPLPTVTTLLDLNINDARTIFTSYERAPEPVRRRIALSVVLSCLGKYKSRNTYIRRAAADPNLMTRSWDFAAKQNEVRARVLRDGRPNLPFLVMADYFTLVLREKLFRRASTAVRNHGLSEALYTLFHEAMYQTIAECFPLRRRNAPRPDILNELGELLAVDVLWDGVLLYPALRALDRRIGQYDMGFSIDMIHESLVDIASDMQVRDDVRRQRILDQMQINVIQPGHNALGNYQLPPIDMGMAFEMQDAEPAAEREEIMPYRRMIAHAYDTYMVEGGAAAADIFNAWPNNQYNEGDDVDEDEHNDNLAALMEVIADVNAAAGNIILEDA